MENTLPLRREFSAGGVVYKKPVTGDQSAKYLLGKHSGYHKWVLPKGMIEPGEKAEETAVREVEEEMGVTARIVEKSPIFVEKYWFYAEMKEGDGDKHTLRRVRRYQEDPTFSQAKLKQKVQKEVKFYLMEWVSGDPGDHDWEMEEAGWFSYEAAVEKLGFEGEKEALKKARNLLLDS